MYLEPVRQCCDMNLVSDVSPILFVCTCNREYRVVLWEKATNRVPRPMLHSMNSMNLETRTKLILPFTVDTHLNGKIIMISYFLFQISQFLVYNK
jgi:hypothetical protein